jgi:hypothetical protein
MHDPLAVTPQALNKRLLIKVYVNVLYGPEGNYKQKKYYFNLIGGQKWRVKLTNTT